MKEERIIESTSALIEAYLECQLPESLYEELWNRIATYPDAYHLFLAHIQLHRTTAEAKLIYNMEQTVRQLKSSKRDMN
ncbi:MAG: hypothetical protein JJU41_04330 [Bacteroidetes bacterium]|nr:hypothetical protein [Bacteroidota bacterium]MCH8523674.1 hypothetical protein [Balneolales bacterium]